MVIADSSWMKFVRCLADVFLSRPLKRAFLRPRPLQNVLSLPVKWQGLDLESGTEGGENQNGACARGIHELPPLAR